MITVTTTTMTTRVTTMMTTRVTTMITTTTKTIAELDKPECIYGSTVRKCSIASQTIKYRYKFKSNQKKVSSKILVWAPPRCVPSLESIARV